jgi:hypothetical protein
MWKRCHLLGALALSLACLPAFADLWDTAIATDDNTGTHNAPVHGTIQVHDLGVRPGPAEDQDWYSISMRGFASYEAIIAGLTGDVGSPDDFEFLAADGTTLLAAAQAVGATGCAGCVQTARFENNQPAPRPAFMRVAGAECKTACDSSDQYTIQFLETTYAVPRYNNVGSQATVLILHNVSELEVSGNIHLFDPSGVRVGGKAFTLPVNNHLVLNTATVAGGAGTSGVMTVSHNGRYGSLAGKAVVLDPSTGFSFDTPLLPRP